MKTSQFVSTPLEPLPKDIIRHNVTYQSQKIITDYTIEPRVALYFFKDLLIHAQLTETNTTLELRPYTLAHSTQSSLTPVKIEYSTPIISPIVLVDNNDDLLYCWLISQDNQIIRHEFTLNNLFNEKGSSQVVVKPLPVINDLKFASVSAAPNGVATVGFVDGSVIHFQEGDKNFPSSSYELDIVDKEDTRLCSYKLHGTTSFPLLKYLNVMTRFALKWDIDQKGSSTQARTTVLTSSPSTDLTVGIRRDHRLVTWTWASGGLNRTLLELPQFDCNGELVDPDEQDMTYQLPGSFTARTQVQKQGEFQQKDGHAYDVKVLVQPKDDEENSHKTIAYIDTQSEPFFAIYNTKRRSGIPVFFAVIIAPTLPTGQFLGFDVALVEKDTLRVWTIWQEARTVFVMSTTIDLISASANAKHSIIRHNDWTTDSFDTLSNSRLTIATRVVDNKNILVGASSEIKTIRQLDKLENLYYHQNEKSEDPVAKAVSILGSMSNSIDPIVRTKLETYLRDNFSKPCDATKFYKTQIETNQALNILAAFPKINKSSATSILQFLITEKQQFNMQQHVQQTSKLTAELVIRAIVDIISARFSLLFCLFIVLSNDENTFKDELSAIWDQLRIYDSLRWIPRHVFERLLEPLVVPADARIDVGSAAYCALLKASDVVENCDTLAKVGEADIALEMARVFLDMSTDEEQGKKTEILRAVKFRSALANHDLNGAIDILTRMKDEVEQATLLESLLEQAYIDENYQTICKLSLQPQVVKNIIQDRAIKQQMPLTKRLSWWQVGYSYFTLANDAESANKCMSGHLKLVGSDDEPLKQFFS